MEFWFYCHHNMIVCLKIMLLYSDILVMYGLEGWKGYFPNQFICLLGVSFVVVADTYCWNSWSPICWLRTVLYILELKYTVCFFSLCRSMIPRSLKFKICIRISPLNWRHIRKYFSMSNRGPDRCLAKKIGVKKFDLLFLCDFS